MKRIAFALVLAGALVAPAIADEDKPKAKPVQGQGQQMDPALKEVVDLAKAGDKAHAEKNYGDAIAKYQEAVTKAKASSMPEQIKKNIETKLTYNMARSQACSGKKEDAIKSLERAHELGMDNWKHISEDKDLEGLKGEAGFTKLVDDMKNAIPNEVKKALAGDALFDFKMDAKTLDGKQVKLEDLKGKVVIVDIWGTWCPPCRKEIPHFVKLYSAYKEKGLEIVGLAKENTKTPEEGEKLVKEFAEKNGITYPLASIGRDDQSIKSVPGFSGFPTTVFIDRTGKVRAKRVGYEEYETLESIVKVLLEAEAK
jgi:thiol-disulfide isomerase/thioredoxin